MTKPQPLLDGLYSSKAQVALRYARGGRHDAVIAVGALTVLAALLRFPTLGLQSFWHDESVTAWLVHASLPKALAAARHETTPPTYYLLIWSWARLFSNSEVALRTLPALAGTLTVPAAYFAAVWGTRSRRIGFVAAALVATSPLLVWYSQEARPYSLLVLTTAISLAFLARALEEPRPLTLGAWAVSCAGALAVHYFAIFLIASQIVWLLITARRKGFFKQALAASGLVAAVEAALIPFALHQDEVGGGAWISTLSLEHRVLAVPKHFAVGLQSGLQRPIELIGAATCLYALWLIARNTNVSERRGAVLFAGLSAAAVALPLSLAVVGKSYLITRNVIAACVPFLLALSAGFGARRGGRPALAAAVVLCSVGIAVSLWVFTNPQYQRADWRGVGQALGPTQMPRVVALNYWPLPLEYYLPRSQDMPQAGVTVSELDVIAIHSSPPHGLCWFGSRCNLVSAIPPADAIPPGFYLAESSRRNQFEIIRYRSPSPVFLTPDMVRTSSLGAHGITVVFQRPPPPSPPVAAH